MSDYSNVLQQVKTLGCPPAPLLLLLLLTMRRWPAAATGLPHTGGPRTQGHAASPAVGVLSLPYICHHVRIHLVSRPRSLRACVQPGDATTDSCRRQTMYRKQFSRCELIVLFSGLESVPSSSAMSAAPLGVEVSGPG